MKPVTYTCNKCGNNLGVFPSGIVLDGGDVQSGACTQMDCKNYGLVQVPSELMLHFKDD